MSTDTLDSSTYEGNPWVDNIERSCPVLYFHFFWGMCMIILGWTTFFARWIDSIRPYHRLMGQIWVYGMIVQIYSSTYARRNGFRWFIFMFGVICYLSLIIGHTFIRKFQKERPKLITNNNNNKNKNNKKVANNNNPIHNNYTNMDAIDGDNAAIIVHSGNNRKDNNNSDSDDSSGSGDSSSGHSCGDKETTMHVVDKNKNKDKNNNGESNFVNIYNEYVTLEFGLFNIPIRMGFLKKLHGMFMFISLIMVTGAGAAFTIRYMDVQDCKNIYSPA